jgi:hypothetical protein
LEQMSEPDSWEESGFNQGYREKLVLKETDFSWYRQVLVTLGVQSRRAEGVRFLLGTLVFWTLEREFARTL